MTSKLAGKPLLYLRSHMLYPSSNMLYLSSLCYTPAPMGYTSAPMCYTSAPVCYTPAPTCYNSSPTCYTSAPMCYTSAPTCKKDGFHMEGGKVTSFIVNTIWQNQHQNFMIHQIINNNSVAHPPALWAWRGDRKLCNTVPLYMVLRCWVDIKVSTPTSLQ